MLEDLENSDSEDLALHLHSSRLTVEWHLWGEEVRGCGADSKERGLARPVVSQVSGASAFSHFQLSLLLDFPGGSDGKESACDAGDLGSIPGLGRSPGEGNGNPLQCSGLEIPIDVGAWQATVHGVPKSRTRLSD